MPRTLPFSQTERKKEDFKKWIKGKRSAEDITQEMLGKKLGITQQSAGTKIRKGQYSYTDLLIIFSVTHATDEEILQLMKL